MKIKPVDIEIPECDPFKHDLLDRERTATTLTNLLQNLEPPYTMSIDASWGNGKTTFLNMWKQHLRNEGFPVVSFNAWETDFTGSPLVALTSELIEELKRLDDNDDLGIKALETKIPKILKIALTKVVPVLISLTGGVVSIQTNEPAVGLAATTFSSGLSVAMEETTKDEPQNDSSEPTTYLDAKATIIDFKTELRNTACALSSKHDNKPLIIAIDELDRCRPSYAVELLEIAKHFFSVDNIVFVLAIDKSQLSHAIKAIYGNDFDATGYLRRFIDLDFRLPDPDRTSFMTHLMGQTGLLQFLEDYPRASWGEPTHAKKLLESFLILPILSVRQIQQAMHRLGLVLASLDSPTNISYGAIAVLVILKTINPALYQRFIQSDMTDKEVIDDLLDLPGLQNMRFTKESALFEALLIMGYCEFSLAKNINPVLGTPSLFHHYYHIIDDNSVPDPLNSTDDTTPSLSELHEGQVLRYLREQRSMFQVVQERTPVGFNLTAQRLELISDDLNGNNA